MKKDDFDYAIENTQVILAPEQQIATFGSTSFNFYLISELMDRVDQVRVRNGKIHAERPQILTPEHYCRLLLEGFGDKAQRYVDQLREHLRNIAVLRYGFQFRKTDVTEETIRDSVDAVINRTRHRVENANEPLSAIIQGVDDAQTRTDLMTLPEDECACANKCAAARFQMSVPQVPCMDHVRPDLQGHWDVGCTSHGRKASGVIE